MTRNPWKSLAPVLAMGFVILVSNELVQHPVQGNFLGVDLAGILTWGAFTYPAAFLVTDTTNRLFGMGPARRVVVAGFAFGVALTLIAALGIAAGVSRSGALSLWQALFRDPDAFAMLRTALASGSAFLAAQLLDIKVFDVLRRHAWGKAPAASSLAGSFVDTLFFFFLAFLAFLACLLSSICTLVGQLAVCDACARFPDVPAFLAAISRSYPPQVHKALSKSRSSGVSRRTGAFCAVTAGVTPTGATTGVSILRSSVRSIVHLSPQTRS